MPGGLIIEVAPGQDRPKETTSNSKNESVKFTDQDVLNQLMEHLDYEYNELGVRPQYIAGYTPTEEELEDKPKSPLLNW